MPARALAALTLLATLAPAQPIDIASRRELFVDRHLIDSLHNAELRLATPRYEGPVFPLDRPHEGPFSGYLTVIAHPAGYRIYYRGLPLPRADGSTDECTAYAESPDGVHWTKPADNIVLRNHAPYTHNFTPFLDPRPNVPPAERWKAIGGTVKTGLAAFASPDGLRWTRLLDAPILPPVPNGRYDSQNLAFWSPSENLYLCYFRNFKRLPNGQSYRWVSRATSPDFRTWSEPVEMTFGDAPPEHLYTNQTSPYFRAPHIYIGIAARFLPKRQVLTDAEAKAIGVDPGYFKDTSDAVLLTTRGGSTYSREFLESFLRPGLGMENWTSRTNYPALNLIQTGPAEMSFFVNRNYGQPTAYVARYSLRLDGFASLHAGYQGGSMTTRPLRFQGSRLELNYSTSAAGSVRLEILDESGKPIPGFTLQEARELIGDQITRTYEWSNGPNLSALANRTVRLRFHLKDADVYSWQFR